MTVWIVGQYQHKDGRWVGCWEFSGVFLSEDEAVKACRDEGYFVFPSVVGQQLPHETVDMELAYYPWMKENSDDWMDKPINRNYQRYVDMEVK